MLLSYKGELKLLKTTRYGLRDLNTYQMQLKNLIENNLSREPG
jgi:hypothetical protein